MSTALAAEDSRAESNIHPVQASEDWIVKHAIAMLERRVFQDGPVLDSPSLVRDYLRLKLITEPNELFGAVFLNAQHRVIAYEPLFAGTVNQTAVYPRVVVQRALAFNSTSVILVHNHPSGVTAPSPADQVLTDRLKAALDTVDIRVLDHFIIGKGTPFSFAEAGLL